MDLLSVRFGNKPVETEVSQLRLCFNGSFYKHIDDTVIGGVTFTRGGVLVRWCVEERRSPKSPTVLSHQLERLGRPFGR